MKKAVAAFMCIAVIAAIIVGTGFASKKDGKLFGEPDIAKWCNGWGQGVKSETGDDGAPSDDNSTGNDDNAGGDVSGSSGTNNAGYTVSLAAVDGSGASMTEYVRVQGLPSTARSGQKIYFTVTYDTAALAAAGYYISGSVSAFMDIATEGTDLGEVEMHYYIDTKEYVFTMPKHNVIVRCLISRKPSMEYV